jgi:hypothetical protein
MKVITDETKQREEVQMQVKIECNIQTEFAKFTASPKREKEMATFMSHKDKI